MGAVFRARDRYLARDVAVKVLDAARPGTDAADGLRREAEILATLEHPGIVPVYDAGTLADGRAFYVMRLVHGSRLDVSLEGRGFAERLELFLRITDAVAFAHARGIVHRDLKPQNIMLGPFGEVLVMDWGAAHREAGAATVPGVVIGTPGYMAPEQSEPAAPIDARADVYALGVLLQAMLVSPVPRPIAAVSRHACQARPDDRYSSVEALARDVARFRDGDRVSVYREPLVERAARIYRRHRVPILLVAAYVVMRVVLLLWIGV